jgi:hypothetical protein
VPPQYWRKLDLQSSNWWWTEIRHKRSWGSRAGAMSTSSF